jgi:hypothetical protein
MLLVLVLKSNIMSAQTEPKPFSNCPALDGYHCQTNSLAKIFHYYGHPLSEDMLLGLGSGMGFIFWHQKDTWPFIGGRANLKSFFSDTAKRTSVKIEVKSTSSVQKAEKRLLALLSDKIPVMMFGDMGMLPWFDLPDNYHFGGHTFVICGFDGNRTVLASDMEQKAAGLKQGIYSPVSLDELKKARSSAFKPFPPKNTWLEFDFSRYRDPDPQDIYSAIKQTAEMMLYPPISNVGIKGFYRTAKEIEKWPDRFGDKQLRMFLFNIYIFIEVGGTGGGCFRYMYSRFLKEACRITGNGSIEKASEMIYESGRLFTETGLLFKEIESAGNINNDIKSAVEKLKQAAAIEEKAYQLLLQRIPSFK